MAQVMGIETGLNVPGMASSTIGIYILIGLAVIIMLAITAGVIWWYFEKRLYKYSIVVFENIAGQGWTISTKDTAKYLRLSKDGTEVLFLRKKKIPLTAYGTKMGVNQYWFAIGQDGGWYNIKLGDLDAKMGTLDIEPVDRDIKYISVAMRKNAAENYGPKTTWFDKYGSWMMGGITLIIISAGSYFLIEQIGVIAKELSVATAEYAKMAEPVQRALGHVDSICSGGTGLLQA